MIVIETDMTYAIYVRTNRRVKWRYASYGGRYDTVEDAIESARRHFPPNTQFEYRVEDFNGDVVATGFNLLV